MDDFWVFGYGSLMWRPGFEFKEQRPARLYGYRRTLCVRSYVHRGTPENPGLVLGLDRGGSCCGIAFRVCVTKRDEVMSYLASRELVTNVYLERISRVQLDCGARIEAVSYVVDRDHEQYACNLDVVQAAEIVRHSKGQSGPNSEYVLSTVAQLKSMNLKDQWLEDVAKRLTV